MKVGRLAKWSLASRALAGMLALAGVGAADSGQWDLQLGRNSSAPGFVFCAHADGQDLFVSGFFHSAGNVAVTNLARWDGQGWWPLSPPLQSPAVPILMAGGADDLLIAYSGNLGLAYLTNGKWNEVANGPTNISSILRWKGR